MIDFITNILTSTQNPVFWASATLGTTFFLLRLIMSLFGGVFSEHDIDVDSMHNEHHHDGPLLKLLTLHSISGFLMVFGWAGLACNEQYNMSTGLSFIIALACGFAMLVTTVVVMRSAMSLEGSGSVFSIKKTIGLIGTVSQRIPAQGQGKVQLTINNASRELLAQSSNKKPIESFTVVKVVRVIDQEIIEVIELEEKSL